MCLFVFSFCGETGIRTPPASHSPESPQSAGGILCKSFAPIRVRKQAYLRGLQLSTGIRTPPASHSPESPQSAGGILCKDFAPIRVCKQAYLRGLQQNLCGETGIRTPETLLAFTRFPGVPLQPLEHLSLGHQSEIGLKLQKKI